MQLKTKYIVIKIDDVEKYLSEREKEYLESILATLNDRRVEDNKIEIKGIFIRNTWPEYWPTYDLLSNRVDLDNENTIHS